MKSYGEQERSGSSQHNRLGQLWRHMGRQSVESPAGSFLAESFLNEVTNQRPSNGRIVRVSSDFIPPEAADEALELAGSYFNLPAIKSLSAVQELAAVGEPIPYERGFNMQPLITHGLIAKLGSLAVPDAHLILKEPHVRGMFSLVLSADTPRSLFAVQNIQPAGQEEQLRLHYARIAPQTNS